MAGVYVVLKGSSVQRLCQVDRDLGRSRDRLRRMVDVDPLALLGDRRALDADCCGVQKAVGISVLGPGGDVDAAIDEADRRLYGDELEGKRW